MQRAEWIPSFPAGIPQTEEISPEDLNNVNRAAYSGKTGLL